MTKPIIKWAGGKTQLLNEIKNRMPKEYNKYHEPFVGGGALFFDLEPENAIINDYNSEIANLYKTIKEQPEELIANLNKLQTNHSEEQYYAIRKDFNTRINGDNLTTKDASQLIYLNKMGFNGLYRVNSQGLYNVPSGKKKKCILYNEENIMKANELLKHTTILNTDFEEACKNINTGDFVFFDSPYYDTFDNYQKNGFSKDDHIRLANIFKDLSNRGVYCMLTNSNTEFIKDLYKDYYIEVVPVKRMINRNGNDRTGEEIIVTNYLHE